jgi:hypothetical protein
MTLAAEKTFAVEGIRSPDSSLAREITELVRLPSPLVHYWRAWRNASLAEV